MKQESAPKWLERHMCFVGDECLFWPFAKDTHGYAQVYVGGGRIRKAHLVVCERVHGPRPSPDHQASHACGNGHRGCVNPRHLSWKTRSENQLDRRKHGTAITTTYGQTGKVTVDDARTILAMRRQNKTQEHIAKAVGVSKPTVRRILAGKTRVAKQAAARM